MDLWLKINANAIVRTRMYTKRKNVLLSALHFTQKMCGSLNAETCLRTQTRTHTHAYAHTSTHIQNGEFESDLSGCSFAVVIIFSYCSQLISNKTQNSFIRRWYVCWLLLGRQLPYERQLYMYTTKGIQIYTTHGQITVYSKYQIWKCSCALCP